MAIHDPQWPRADAWLAVEDPQPDLVVVGVPSSRASITPSRADLTPGELRERLSRFSTFQGEYQVDFGQVKVRDMGNWPVSEMDMFHMPEAVEERSRNLPEARLTLFLGGDNAITRPLVKGVSPAVNRLGLITFDAHHDVRSLENGPTNGTPIRGLIEEDGLQGPNVTQIGIHSFANSAAYRRYCDDAGITTVTIQEIEARGIPSIVTGALEDLADRCEQIYVDVDLDVLDRVFAPACPGSRPGGMTIRDLASAVYLCGLHPSVTAMDFVEVDAAADIGAITLDATAHVFLSAVAGFSARPSRSSA